MIDSINPTFLMDYAMSCAQWAVRWPESLGDELDQLKATIDVFCKNNDDPIYKGVAIICDACVDVTKQIIVRSMEQETPAQPEEAKEVSEDGRDETAIGVSDELRSPSSSDRGSTRKRKDRSS
jgi:hypothetical protein